MNYDMRFDHIRAVGGGRYQAFLDAGYREHYSTGVHSTPYLLQKRIRDEGGTTLYFVNTWAYDFSRYPQVPDPFGILPEVQFNSRSDQGPTFNVSMHDRADDTPETIEAFFRRIYDAMGCQPYGDD